MKPPLSYIRSKSAEFDWVSSEGESLRGKYTASVLDLLPSLDSASRDAHAYAYQNAEDGCEVGLCP